MEGQYQYLCTCSSEVSRPNSNAGKNVHTNQAKQKGKHVSSGTIMYYHVPSTVVNLFHDAAFIVFHCLIYANLCQAARLGSRLVVYT